jgi:hypothetical protein
MPARNSASIPEIICVAICLIKPLRGAKFKQPRWTKQCFIRVLYVMCNFFIYNVWLHSYIVTQNKDYVHLFKIWKVKFRLIVNTKGLLNTQLINWQC